MEPQMTPARLAETVAQNGATIYAELMRFSLAEPEEEIYKFVRERTNKIASDLTDLMVQQLRKAYIAGVADGHRAVTVEASE